MVVRGYFVINTWLPFLFGCKYSLYFFFPHYPVYRFGVFVVQWKLSAIWFLCCGLEIWMYMEVPSPYFGV